MIPTEELILQLDAMVRREPAGSMNRLLPVLGKWKSPQGVIGDDGSHIGTLWWWSIQLPSCPILVARLFISNADLEKYQAMKSMRALVDQKRRVLAFNIKDAIDRGPPASAVMERA